MRLELEAREPILDPSEEQIRSAILSLGSGPTFASLTMPSGDYVQIAGGRPWVVLERRQTHPLCHQRAYTLSGRRPYKDGAKLFCTPGPIIMREDEWLLQKQAIEVLLAFARNDDFPEFTQWRDIGHAIGLVTQSQP
ncbi:hypothetical protein [Sphingomonas sp.]|uniref:hypothetical protein n=1 Tax=Sphingomonas sp. TaxID=28214 RepID=UPI001B117820|nr:hypothetical protein [Sphingomonas sp.]MBO9712050.1 hypothetical protein [Sphingomonas sp.]